MNIGSPGGIDIGQLFQNATNALSQDGQALQAKMDQISASGEVDQMQLLELQFAMGQYNAKLETISSVTKSIQDMLKSLASGRASLRERRRTGKNVVTGPFSGP